MLRAGLGLSLLAVLASAAAALALTPEEEALLSGRKAPVVTTVKKPATPRPLPTEAAVAAPFVAVAPAFALPAGWGPVPKGELSWQEGGQLSLDPQSAVSFGNTRMGLALHGEQGDTLWDVRTAFARQNMTWQLADLGAIAFFGTQSHLTLGDEPVTFGQLLIDDMPVRGGHARYGTDAFTAQAFLGGDRPVLAGFPSDRTMGGASFELPRLGALEAARIGIVGQDDRLALRRGAALSLGGRTAVGPAVLAAELAASGGSEAPDTGYRLEGTLPWSLFTFKASHLRQGPYFQTVRTLGMPTGGTRTQSSASAEAEAAPGLKGVLAVTATELGADGSVAQARSGSRGADLGLSYAPEGASWSANVNLARTAFDTDFGTGRFGMTLDRVSPELRLPLPLMPGARARWDWLISTPDGASPSPLHLLTFDAGRLGGTAFSAIETVTVAAGTGTRLNHAAAWSGSLWKDRLGVGSRGFVEHPLGPGGYEGRCGLNLTLGVLVTETHALDLIGTVDRSFSGATSTMSWSLRYASRFGDAPGHAAEAAVAAIEGRVVAPAGLGASDLGALRVRLGRSQYTAVGPDGRFRFSNLAPGPYAVSLDIARLPTGYTLAPSQAVVAVQAERGKTIAVRFALAVAHQVRGRVVGPRGEGVEGVEVALAGPERYTAWTDGEGAFVVEDVVEGTYAAQLVLPADSRLVGTGEAVAVTVGAAGASVEPRFTLEERTRRLELPGLDPFAVPEPPRAPAAPSGAVAAAGFEAVVMPHPVKAGRKASLKVLVRGKPVRVRALVAGRWQVLRPVGRGVHQLTFTAPATKRPLVGTIVVELGQARHRLTYQVNP